MKKLLTLTALTLAFSAPAIAQDAEKEHDGKRYYKGKMFEKLDIDGNGEVTKSEFTSFHEKKFDDMDADKSGSVTKEEAQAAHEKMREKMKEYRKHKMEKSAAEAAPEDSASE